MAGERQLAVNADDFGFTRDVNDGIVEAHRNGILTSTTIMANGREFDHAVALAKETPTLDIGVHCVLVGGEGQPATVGALIRAMAMGHVYAYEELRTQVLKVLDAGLRVTHLDTHKHTHLLPPVLDAVARLGQEFGVKWVRRPIDFPLSGRPENIPASRRWVSRAAGPLRARIHRKLARHGCRTTDWFAGFEITGMYGAEEVVRLIEGLPEGTTEFMVHPGFCTDELRGARTRLKESREAELRALTDARVKEAIAAGGVTLTGFGEMREK
jgi:predicted glycoside hydrolase/deacetylase ChbG (UPF0249 family)